jgi:GTP cyclohydrolase II
MSKVRTDASSPLFGSKGHISVSRGLADIHGGRPVLITAADKTLLALPVEGLDGQRLAAFMALCSPSLPRLIITERRALALGLRATTPMALRLAANDDASTILALVTDAKGDCDRDASPAGSEAVAAIQLVKLSHGLPAILAANAGADVILREPNIIAVEADAVWRFSDEAGLGTTEFGHARALRRIPRCDRRELGCHRHRQA